MKKILLSAAFMAAAFLGNAQTEDFNDALPQGWVVNRDLKIGRYENPANGCADDTGLITPPILFNTPAAGLHLATTAPARYSSAVSSFTLRFDAFAFNPDTRDFDCDDNEATFNCATSVKVYMVPANYNSTDIPTGTNVLGESDFVVLQTGEDANTVTINVNAGLTVGTQYKFFVVGRTQGCSEDDEDAQIYVVDNIRLVGSTFNMDFSEAFPEGWNFNRELQITQYCNAQEGETTDIGLVTPAVSNVGSNHFATSPGINFESARPLITVRFDLFAFEASTRGFGCNDDASSLNCNAQAKIYLVANSYTGTSEPTGAAVLGESNWVSLQTVSSNITISVRPGITLNTSNRYRLVVFTRAANCNSGAQVYVVDNINISEAPEAILPVTFKSFNAQRNKNNVTLTWETAMEENNRGFHVQRNIDGTWKNIGFVNTKAAGGNSSELLSYSFNDVNTTLGVSQYRLLQVDHDNKGRYSEIRSVRGENQKSKIMVYPNPSNTGNVNVMFEDASALRDVLVSDVSGRVVKQFRNVNGNTLTIENLVDGYYTIQITNNTTAATTVEKVIIKKR